MPRLSALLPALLLLALLPPLHAQTAPCAPPLSQYEGFTLRRVEVRAPFSLPAVLRARFDPDTGVLPRAGDPWRQAQMGQVTKSVVDAVSAAPLLELPFAITVAPAYIENCDASARTLDLLVYVFATRLLIPGQWTWESASARRQDPRAAAGLTPPRYRVQFAPLAAYDQAGSLSAGGRLALDHRASGFRLAAEGAGASRSAHARLTASGGLTPECSALWTLTYGAGYRFLDDPLLTSGVRQGYGFGWLSGATRPVSSLAGAVRYAAQFERGYQSAPAAHDGTRYSAVKMLAGASGGAGRHDYSVTSAFQLGSAGGINTAWSKALLDATYAVRLAPALPAFDHRFIDLEFRATGGWLDARNQGRIPANERFFGGLREHRFTDIPDWDVRSTPLIRSYPNNRLLPSAGSWRDGRQRFFSLNVTAAFTTYRLPLIPRQVRESPGFRDQINAGKGTAEAALLSYHEAKDPAMEKADSAAAALQPVLAALAAALDSLTVPDSLSEAKDLCLEAVENSQTMLEKARETRAFAALLNRSAPGALPPLLQACGADFQAANQSLRPKLGELDTLRARIDDIIANQVDHRAVQRRARNDSRIAVRALDAFANEINLLSLDPIVVFDRAWIRSGPASAPALLRYAVGGGLRFTLASTLSFEAGYAATTNRARGEPHGAVFFHLRFHDLIR